VKKYLELQSKIIEKTATDRVEIYEVTINKSAIFHYNGTDFIGVIS